MVENDVKIERKIRNYIPIGVIEDLGLTIGNLSDWQKLPITSLRTMANGMIIEGDPFTKESDIMDIMDVLFKTRVFLEEGGRMAAMKAKLKATRSPKP